MRLKMLPKSVAMLMIRPGVNILVDMNGSNDYHHQKYGDCDVCGEIMIYTIMVSQW